MLVAARALVNVYREASEETEVTSQVIYGWGVAVLEEQGEWRLVKMHDGYTGWVRLEDFEEGKEGNLRVEGSSANVYMEKDVKRRAALLHIPWEARLCGVEEEDGWWRVRLADGRNGFVHRGDVAADWPVVDVEGMLAVGQRFLGVTYTWGGVTSFGYDCSGFVQMLLRQRRISIPRDAQAQARWEGFERVEVGKVNAGDVIFFGASEDEITHVGMCMGAGKFLHDTTEGRPGVQISRLEDEPWTTRVCGARRIRG